MNRIENSTSQALFAPYTWNMLSPILNTQKTFVPLTLDQFFPLEIQRAQH